MSEFSGSSLIAVAKSFSASACWPFCIFRLPRFMSAFERTWGIHENKLEKLMSDACLVDVYFYNHLVSKLFQDYTNVWC